MIIGHKKQQQLLKKIISLKEIPHALLFTGSEELGKRTIALELFLSIFKEKLTNHPDFILITPKGKKIQIAQIRDLNWRLSLKPVKAPILGTVIDKAHLMTWEAQNCFLKTLEEPKTKSLVILITEHPKYLLPTILSRCENVKFYPVKKEEISMYLEQEKVLKEKIEQIVDLSLGRPGRAINFFKDPERLEGREKRIKKLTDISNSPLSLRFKYAKQLVEEKNLIETLNSWLFHFRKRLFLIQSKQNLLKTKNILNAISETIHVISTTNTNQRLALEILMIKL